VLTVLCVLSCLPGLVPALLLDPESANIIVLAVCLLPLAPAVSATMFAWRAKARGTESAPTPAFRHGYRVSALDSLRVAMPVLAVLAVLAWTVLNIGAAAVAPGYGWVLVAIAVLVVLVSVQALVIATLYSFRLRDVWRLAVYYTYRLPLVTLAVAALLTCVLGLVWVSNEAVGVLALGVVCALLLRYQAPVLNDIERTFIAP